MVYKINLFRKIKNDIFNFFIPISDPPEAFEDNQLVNNLKMKIKKKSKNEKLYLTSEMALNIANSDKTLKRDLYNDAIDKGFTYGIIELKDFYTTLVKYNNSLYWYIKVIKGNYGLKYDNKNEKGCLNKYSNIRCLINAIDGKYIYIDKDFNTNELKMISDEEYLKIVLKFHK